MSFNHGTADAFRFTQHGITARDRSPRSFKNSIRSGQRAVPNPKRGFTATSTAGTAIGSGHHHTAQQSAGINTKGQRVRRNNSHSLGHDTVSHPRFTV